MSYKKAQKREFYTPEMPDERFKSVKKQKNIFENQINEFVRNGIQIIIHAPTVSIAALKRLKQHATKCEAEPVSFDKSFTIYHVLTNP